MLRAEAAATGADLAVVSFRRDPVRGAVVQVKTGAQALQAALAKYAVAAEVVDCGAEEQRETGGGVSN